MNARNVIKFLRLEANKTSRPFSRPDLLLSGFLSCRADHYDFEKFKKELYVSDWETEFLLGRLNEKSDRRMLADKLLFHLLIPGEPSSTLVGYFDSGVFIPTSTFPDLSAALQAFGSLVVKPRLGSKGQGVRLITAPEALEAPDQVIVESPLQNHAYSNAIYPDSLNTIRVVVMKDARSWFIVGASHRFGTRKSGFTDNFSSGGVAASVELETGELGAAKCALQSDVQDLDRHPDTGTKIKGTLVPKWGDVCAAAIRLAEKFPSLNHIGWDLAVTEEGVVVVEGNANLPNPNIIQIGAPILLNKRVRDLLFDCGVIGKRRLKKLNAAEV